MAVFGAGDQPWELTYNGYTFDPQYTLLTSLHTKPVSDRAGRTTAYVEFAFSFQTTIVGAVTSAAVQTARRLLEKQGGAFKFIGRSFGDIDINTSVVKDCNYGPKTTVLGWKFLGPKTGTRIDWQIVVCIPDCQFATYTFAMMDVSYTVEHRLRRNGRADRVIRGTVRIPNNRSSPGAKSIIDSPDEYRDKIAGTVPRWFRREYEPWVLNEARTELRFGWTDYEIDRNPLPEGIVHATASHHTHSNNSIVSYMSTITASYELAAGCDYTFAERAFARLVKQRIEAHRKNPVKPGAVRVTAVPIAFSPTEPDMYGDNKANFSLTYMVIAATVANVIRNSGMWLETGDDWNKWYSSVRKQVGPYGFSDLRFKAVDDAIVDLCDDTVTKTWEDSALGTLRSAFPAYPYPESSWVAYTNDIHVEVDSGLSTYRRIGVDKPTGFDGELTGGGTPSPLGPTPGGNPFAVSIQKIEEAVAGVIRNTKRVGYPFPDVPTHSNDTGKLTATLPGADDGSYQQRAASGCWVYMTGQALRVGWPIPCPELLDVEGVKPIPDNRCDRGEGFRTQVVGNAGAPMYGASWNLRYYLPRMPAKPITPPPNPLLEQIP